MISYMTIFGNFIQKLDVDIVHSMVIIFTTISGNDLLSWYMV